MTSWKNLINSIDWDRDPGYQTSYRAIVESTGVNIILWQYLGEYQGDILALVQHKEGFYGYASIGYGSCSGCDVLYAAENKEDLSDIRRWIWDHIRWFKTPADALEYFTTKDWEVEYFSFYDKERTNEFVQAAIAIFKGE